MSGIARTAVPIARVGRLCGNAARLARSESTSAAPGPSTAAPSEPSTSLIPHPVSAHPEHTSAHTSSSLPKPVLRKLVDLHHHSSTFLSDPSAFPAGFKTAFKSIRAPSLEAYEAWSDDILSLYSRRGGAGLATLRPRLRDGVGGVIEKGQNPPAPVQRSRSAWTGENSWERVDMEERLSEREIRVKEALYGTWERGVPGRNRRVEVEVGLEGMEEYLEAKGESVSDLAEKWDKRHEVA